LVWARHGQAMTDDQWLRPTRLGDWDVRSLYAHAARWPLLFSMLVDRVRDADPTHATAAALLRDINAPNGIAHTSREKVATDGREGAATYTAAQMVEQFAGAGPRSIDTARRLGPVVVDYFGLALLGLDEAVSIGIIEATVHLLDLQRALGQPPEVPVGGLTHTTAVLVQMLPQLDFIEAATGRSTTDVFPVLS